MSSEVLNRIPVPRTSEELADSIRLALARDFPYYERPVFREGRPAAVLALFGWSENFGNGPFLLLTRRTELVETHKGQIAFPGGGVDPEDVDAVATALRETWEEVGIPSSAIRVIGELPKLWTITDYWITPVVGELLTPIEQTILSMSLQEIAETFWVPLEQLVTPGVYREEQYRLGNFTHPIHVFQAGERRIWGATGAMVKNLLDRMGVLG